MLEKNMKNLKNGFTYSAWDHLQKTNKQEGDSLYICLNKL